MFGRLDQVGIVGIQVVERVPGGRELIEAARTEHDFHVGHGARTVHGLRARLDASLQPVDLLLGLVDLGLRLVDLLRRVLVVDLRGVVALDGTFKLVVERVDLALDRLDLCLLLGGGHGLRRRRDAQSGDGNGKRGGTGDDAPDGRAKTGF